VADIQYRTYALKKYRDVRMCSVAQHFSIRLQWHFPFAAIASGLNRVLPTTLPHVTQLSYAQNTRAFSGSTTP
jgi:hypothetical protein